MTPAKEGPGSEQKEPGSSRAQTALAWFLRSRLPFGLILGVPALVAGLTVAPTFVRRAYPTDPNLIGTPSSGNIKAPYDVDVADNVTTETLRQEAISRVPRVYDFDVGMGDKLAENVLGAFARMRIKIDAFFIERPELDSHVNKPDARVEAALREALLPAVPEIEKALGTALTPEELTFLLGRRFDPSLASLVGKGLREVMSVPVAASRQSLEVDRALGLSIQRVPSSTSTEVQFIEDVDSVADVDGVRRELFGRAKRLFVDASPIEREIAVGLVARLVDPNLTFNRAATELAREVARLSVKPVMIAVKKGEMVIRDGERLSRRHLLIFDALAQSSAQASFLLITLGAAASALVLIGVGLWVARRRRIELALRDLAFLSSLFVLWLLLARAWLVIAGAVHEQFATWPRDAWSYVMPVAAGAMIVRLVLRTEVALAFGVLMSLVLGLMVDTDRLFPLYAAVGSTLGATVLGSISARGDLLRTGVWVGLAQTASALTLQLFLGVTDPAAYLVNLMFAFVGGLFCGLVALALTPVVEMVFGYSTDLKLLELANLNHPALKELIVQAPGSYHHSVIVGSLVEAAAEQIGANPLLSRVMAYYHDLGKGCNPGYFIENQRAGHNPHDKLKPSMSAMIIRRHVTDGLELAKKYRLGEPIYAAIGEHHGTTLIHYFFHKAKEQEEEGNPVHESDYRYPGQKPQTREAALVMLGDSVEAASRSLSDPTPARLAGLVSRIINLKFTDGQLDECDLTLRDLHTIAKSFSRVLASIYHQRPEYPELLKDLTGKKGHGDSDPKPPKKPKGPDEDVVEPRADHLKRLGLS